MHCVVARSWWTGTPVPHRLGGLPVHELASLFLFCVIEEVLVVDWRTECVDGSVRESCRSLGD